MISLEELKHRTEKHMKDELDIMEMIFAIDKRDLPAYTAWYNSHPYCICIEDIREIVQRRSTESDEKVERSGNL